MKTNMKFKLKNIIALSVFCFTSLTCSFAQMAADKAKSLLELADKNTNYAGTDFKADYTIVTDKPGSGKSVTTATMYRRDANSMFTILITGPEADCGKGYVQFDKVIWFFQVLRHQTLKYPQSLKVFRLIPRNQVYVLPLKNSLL